MSTWSDDFLVYATVNDTLTRTRFDEAEHMLNLDAYTPELNNGLLTILKDGPIHMQMPQSKPLCASCREETGK